MDNQRHRDIFEDQEVIGHFKCHFEQLLHLKSQYFEVLFIKDLI